MIPLPNDYARCHGRQHDDLCKSCERLQTAAIEARMRGVELPHRRIWMSPPPEGVVCDQRLEVGRY